ncbi:hypothetical protein GF362_01750 [Candidatus Dojkabacteria bacterium]|nr:hypothetical protein [Candidatus Dojkabacteria bacterium]
MFQDEETRKFMLYAFGTGILMVVMACVVLTCLVPGNERNCRVPFVVENEDETDFIYTDPPEYKLKEDTDYKAILHTNKGDIKIDLFEEAAPTTVNNFVFLSLEGYYNEVKWHRVFRDLLIQTGSRKSLDDDPENDGYGSPGYTIPDEINWDALDIPEKKRKELREAEYESTPGLASKPMRKYSVAMANEHRGNTNGSQFFIVTAEDTDTRLEALEGKHTVFGEVIDGFEAVKEINEVKVDDSDPDAPYPKRDVYIDTVDIIEIREEGVYENGTKTDNAEKDQTIRLD